MQNRFDGKVAIVTGAGGGLGRQYAQLLASRGAKVLVNDLGGTFDGQGSDESYAETAARRLRELGGTAEANHDTVATAEGARSIVTDALNRWGQVDILVNNAGIVSAHDPLPDVTDKQWNDDLAVSAGGTFFMCREVWQQMLDRDYGRIVNTVSASIFGMGSSVPYPAAKGAVLGITRGLASAARAQSKNVAVNAVMPVAASRMTALMGSEIEEVMKRNFPTEAVAPVVGLLAHESAPCNGEVFTAGGGGFARVFLGVSTGYRGTDKAWTIEDVATHFPAAMDLESFSAPADSMAEAALYDSDVDWNAFRAYVR